MSDDAPLHGRFARLHYPEEWATSHWDPVDHDPEPDDGEQKTEDGDS